MTDCPLFPTCGGCRYRNLSDEDYQNQKFEHFKQVMSAIHQSELRFGEPVFIPTQTRRRAAMAFSYVKKQFVMGFNAAQSAQVVDCCYCDLLTERLNRNLGNIRAFVQELCAEPFTQKKGKKIIRHGVTGGDILLCDADNGIDITLELPFSPELAHRMIISEYAARTPDVLRVSWRQSVNAEPETMLEKSRPIIHNSGTDVYIPAGTFLQASKQGERALVELVLKYVGERQGRVADLFCGVGTFSYPLAQNKNNQILAVDSSVELLEGFRQSVNRNQIPNIEIRAANLFKYPLDERKLADIDIVVFDPPRAGAAAQVAKIAASKHPHTVVAVSCNPNTFVNDANQLIASGYALREVTMVDQFIYSKHTELVACFEREE